MPMTPLANPPSRADSLNFAARGDTFMASLPGFVAEANALETNVNAKEASANTSATNASTSASNASTSATSASTSATNAAIARDAAVAARTGAEAALDSFDDRYLGPKATAPTLDNDGAALLVGSLYWDTALSSMRAYTGTAWVTLPAATAGAVANTPSGGVAATNVQGAINEIDVEKADKGAIQAQSHTAVTTAGTATAYVIATLPVQPSLVANQRYRIKLHTPNGAAPTLVRDGLAAAPFRVYNSAGVKVAPAAAALPTLFDVEYDGVDYVVLDPLPPFTGRIPQNTQSLDYTLVLADEGRHLLHPSADITARTWTIPANTVVAFEVGSAVTFVNQNAAGVVTIAITTDIMRLAGQGTVGSRSLAANGVATALKITPTEWLISGTGLT